MLMFALGLWWLAPLDPLKAGILVASSMGLGVSVPHFLLTCQRLGVTPGKHFREVYFKPLISNVFFLLFMVWADDLMHAGDWAVAGVVAVTGAAALTAAYWTFAFDDGMRAMVWRHVARSTR
jgi:hypothetical protein